MKNNSELGKKIKYYRNMYGSTQSELAAEIGVETLHIANIENGRKGVSLDKLVLICRHFRINLSDVLPIEKQDDIELRNQWKNEIVNALDNLDTNQLGIVKKMVCSLLSD